VLVYHAPVVAQHGAVVQPVTARPRHTIGRR
jgi:hypothetical protein